MSGSLHLDFDRRPSILGCMLRACHPPPRLRGAGRVPPFRNPLVGRRPSSTDALRDLETSGAGHRVLEKGVKVDLRTTIHSRGDVMWEGTSTFYFRGRFGPAD